jgi:hypothetical protein
VKEVLIAKKTLGSGSEWDIAFSIETAQKCPYCPACKNKMI